MFASRSLSKLERNYCVTWRELLAVVFAIRKFRHYLSQRFTIRTDHSSLRWLLASKDPEGQMARWLLDISTYDSEIQHRPGRQHNNADGLSRAHCSQCGREEETKQKEETQYPLNQVTVIAITLGEDRLAQAQARVPEVLTFLEALKKEDLPTQERGTSEGTGRLFRMSGVD